MIDDVSLASQSSNNDGRWTATKSSIWGTLNEETEVRLISTVVRERLNDYAEM